MGLGMCTLHVDVNIKMLELGLALGQHNSCIFSRPAEEVNWCVAASAHRCTGSPVAACLQGCQFSQIEFFLPAASNFAKVQKAWH